MKTYIGMISSDWSQCLSPSGPFDPFVFHYPHMEKDLQRIFKRYTTNNISLGQAVIQVKALLPAQLTIHQMDAYLDARFKIYKGVEEFIRWCGEHRILFMINTTGFMGYFQRMRAKGRLPEFAVLSAQSMLRFEDGPDDPTLMVDLFEIEDKAINTAAIAKHFQISPNKMILLGDSGGDGPHFDWGSRKGASLIGSMPKPSLIKYCEVKGVRIDHLVGHTYSEGEEISLEKERTFDFRTLTEIVTPIMGID